MERLSSGLRINRARDDAAGLGVATNLRTDVRSSSMALRNVEEALEMANVADSGIHEAVDVVQRMRALAVASASETLADEERAYLDDEYGELLAQLDDIAHGTDYNDTTLLGPRPVDILFMVDVSDSMGNEIPAFRAELGTFIDTMNDAGLAVRISLIEVSNTRDSVDGASVRLGLTDDRDRFDASLSTLVTTGLGLMDPYTTMLDQTGVVPLAGDDGPEIPSFRKDARKLVLYAADRPQEIALSAATEADTAQALADAGFTAHIMGVAATSTAAFDDIATVTGGSFQNMSAFGVGFDTMLDNIAQQTIAESRPVQGIEVQAGIQNDADSRIALGFPVDLTTVAMGLDTTAVDTAAAARGAIDALDGALVTMNRARATLGASVNRLESTARHHITQIEALSSAESQVRNADYAVVTSELTASQIVQQSGIAAQAQANQLHAQAIPSLLG